MRFEVISLLISNSILMDECACAEFLVARRSVTIVTINNSQKYGSKKQAKKAL